MSEKNLPVSGSINLFHQTPDDKEIGDVFGGLQGRYFILEFKRDSKHLNSELNKEARNKLIQKIGLGTDELFHISFKSHLMIYPSWTEGNQLNYSIQPYLKSVWAEAAKVYENPFSRINSPRKFIDQLYEAHSSLGCNIVEIGKYIDLLKSCNISSSSSSASNGGRNTTSGLVIFSDPNEGEMQSFKFDSLDQLHLEIQKTLAVSIKTSRQQRIELENNIRKKRELDKGKDKGHSIGN